MERIPTTEELNKHYAKYSYSEDSFLSPITIKSYHQLLDEFEKYRVHNKILDVGCGRGFFLVEARKRGWEVYGTEYAEEAIKLCRSKGIEMRSGQLQEDSFSPEEFDVITSFEVIEHINNPQEEVKLIHRFLKKGGLFYCTTPNFNAYLRYQLKAEYNVIGYPEHLSYYTRRTLKKLFKANGFKALKVLTTGISITRLKTSKKASSEKLISNESQDEKLRKQIEGNKLLGIAKKIVNFFLSLFGLGISLKGYFIKK